MSAKGGERISIVRGAIHVNGCAFKPIHCTVKLRKVVSVILLKSSGRCMSEMRSWWPKPTICLRPTAGWVVKAWRKVKVPCDAAEVLKAASAL